LDKRLEQLKQEYFSIPIPPQLDKVVRQALQANRKRRRMAVLKGLVGLMACAALLIVSVNLNPSLAQAMSEIPVLGNLIRLVTVAQYRYEDGGFQADLKVPAITNMENAGLQDALNAKYLEENQRLYETFMKEMEELKKNGGENYAINGGYQVVTDTEQLLTIQRYVVQIGASGTETLKYDTIDKQRGILITLPSLFKDDGYVQVISEYIKAQMREQMAKDDGIIYWIDGRGDPVEFKEIARDQNFYINEDGKLVISFNEYEVAPGYMGTVEFVIPTEVIQPLLVSNEYIK
jgi:hypothetical protein